MDSGSDIYSLVIILYELATGRVPYMAETPVAVVFMHVSGPLPLPRSLNPELPEAVERVILKALARNPDDRYQTAEDLVAA
jgi:serine/threonine-protein kinase